MFPATIISQNLAPSIATTLPRALAASFAPMVSGMSICAYQFGNKSKYATVHSAQTSCQAHYSCEVLNHSNQIYSPTTFSYNLGGMVREMKTHAAFPASDVLSHIKSNCKEHHPVVLEEEDDACCEPLDDRDFTSHHHTHTTKDESVPLDERDFDSIHTLHEDEEFKTVPLDERDFNSHHMTKYSRN